MFYSVFVLGKKGPLARVWLAAHWDKKITKAQILETNIVESVDSILQPKVKLSLRTSSHLLLGIVRIYARKAAYLLQDCQDAAFKIKSAFRPGVVDLPDGKTEAAISAITLPDNYEFINDFDFVVETQFQMEPTTTANLRNITLIDDVSGADSSMMLDSQWSDIGSIGKGSIAPGDYSDSGTDRAGNGALDDPDFDRPMDDGFGGCLGIMDDDVFGMTLNQQNEAKASENGYLDEKIADDDDDGFGALLTNGAVDGGRDSPAGRPGSALSMRSDDASIGDYGASPGGHSSPAGSPAPDLDELEPFGMLDDVSVNPGAGDDTGSVAQSSVANEGEPINSMVLEPLDSQVGAGLLERKRKRRKKIGMAIDEMKTLSGEEMKSQLSDTSDIVTNLDLAPPNKILMNWKKTGLVDKLFSLPQRSIPCKVLSDYYGGNLITIRHEPNADDLDESDLLQPEGNEITIDYSLPDQLFSANVPDLIDDQDDEDAFQNSADFAVPKTPKSPKSNRKRKTEDKENQKEVSGSKRAKYGSKFDQEGGKAHEVSAISDNTQYGADGSVGGTAPLNGTAHRESSIGAQMENQTGNESAVNHTFGGQDFDATSDKEDDDGGDYDYGGNGPMSVEPPEEILPEETLEQFVERVQTKRSTHLFKRMQNQLEATDHINFSSISRNNNRKMAAQNFYGLLVLKKQMAVELYQDSSVPYGEIVIRKGYKFDEQAVAV